MSTKEMIHALLIMALFGLCCWGVIEVVRMFKIVIAPNQTKSNWYDDVHVMD